MDTDPRFTDFIILQAQNAGLFLGQAARSVLDSLEMLQTKTRGNLTETEEKLLQTALDNLQPLYDSACEEHDSDA